MTRRAMRGRPHTAVAFLTFFLVLVVQVQHCRHFKQLQQVIYSRRGIANEELDNADIDQYRYDFMVWSDGGTLRVPRCWCV